MKLISINLLRTLAIFLMFITHCIRLLPKSIWSENLVFSFFMSIEPFTSAMFLFLVGFSMVLSKEKSIYHKQWAWAQVRRALVLYLLGVALFIPEFGVQIPDMIFSPNILSAISLSIIVNLLIMRSQIASSVFLVLCVIGELVLDAFHMGISGLNSGPGGALILVAFSVVGQMCATHKKVEKDVWILSALMFLLSLTQPWVISYAKQYWPIKTIILFPARTVSFWTHTSFAFLGLSSIFVFLTHFIFKYPINSKQMDNISIPGTNSLDLYIIHLCILGILVFMGVSFSVSIVTFLMVFFVIFSYFYSFGKAKIKDNLKRKKA